MGQSDSKKIAFLTLGCKLNYAETSTYERGFVQAGFSVVPWGAGADVYLVNTCSVTAMADAKSRNLVRKVLRVNPEAAVIVTGCSAQLRRADYEGIPGVARVFGCNEKSSVVPDTLAMLGVTSVVSPDPDPSSPHGAAASAPVLSSRSRTAATTTAHTARSPTPAGPAATSP